MTNGKEESTTIIAMGASRMTRRRKNMETVLPIPIAKNIPQTSALTKTTCLLFR
jgi:hypothetical protein